MKYQLVTGDSEKHLTNNVNTLLKDGWGLYGSPSISMGMAHNAQFFKYAQAVIKKEETDTK